MMICGQIEPDDKGESVISKRDGLIGWVNWRVIEGKVDNFGAHLRENPKLTIYWAQRQKIVVIGLRLRYP